MYKKLRQKIEQQLYKRGCTSALIRQFLCTQFLLACFSFFVGILCFPVTTWPILFSIGVIITFYNFWAITQFVQQVIYHSFTYAMAFRLIAGFIGRLVLTGLILSGLILWLEASPVPLLLGLTAALAGITYWGFSQLPQKPVKEA